MTETSMSEMDQDSRLEREQAACAAIASRLGAHEVSKAIMSRIRYPMTTARPATHEEAESGPAGFDATKPYCTRDGRLAVIEVTKNYWQRVEYHGHVNGEPFIWDRNGSANSGRRNLSDDLVLAVPASPSGGKEAGFDQAGSAWRRDVLNAPRDGSTEVDVWVGGRRVLNCVWFVRRHGPRSGSGTWRRGTCDCYDTIEAWRLSASDVPASPSAEAESEPVGFEPTKPGLCRREIEERAEDWLNEDDSAQHVDAQETNQHAAVVGFVAGFQASRPASPSGGKEDDGANGWLPIASAPRDGRVVDLWACRDVTGNFERQTDCCWGRRTFGTEPVGEPTWLGFPDRYSTYTPTHWRPLPPPPGARPAPTRACVEQVSEAKVEAALTVFGSCAGLSEDQLWCDLNRNAMRAALEAARAATLGDALEREVKATEAGERDGRVVGMSEFSIVLGWSAPPMKEQYPCLNVVDAEQFDLNSAATSRLSIQGLITRSQRDAAAHRLTKAVGKAVSVKMRRE